MIRFGFQPLVFIVMLTVNFILTGCGSLPDTPQSSSSVETATLSSVLTTSVELDETGSLTDVSEVTSPNSSELTKSIILYVEDGQIWWLDTVNDKAEQLTFDEGKDSKVFTPKWSPTGENFAFKRYSKLWLGDNQGTLLGEIISEASSFWWINDKILRYCVQKNETTECFLYNTEAESTAAIETNNYWIFAFSPEINKIFVQEYQLSDEKIQPSTTQYLLDLTTNQKIFEHQTSQGFWTEDPRWTQDKPSTIVFTAGLAEQSSRGEIFTVDEDGKNLKQLTNFSQEEGTFIYPALLQWSPNNQKLAFIISTAESNELAIVNADGSSLNRLGVDWTTLGTLNLSPVWSPDNQKIAFLSNQIDAEDNWQIYTVNVETGNISQLTNSPGDKTWLDWK